MHARPALPPSLASPSDHSHLAAAAPDFILQKSAITPRVRYLSAMDMDSARKWIVEHKLRAVGVLIAANSLLFSDSWGVHAARDFDARFFLLLLELSGIELISVIFVTFFCAFLSGAVSGGFLESLLSVICIEIERG